jgi:integrase
MSRCTFPLIHNPLAMRALAAFRTRGEGTGRVIRNAAGETLVVNAHWFPDALRAAGIANLHWHDLRHTFASRLRTYALRTCTKPSPEVQPTPQ